MDPFVGKLLSAVTLEDLKRLVDNGVSENIHLDFKRELHLDDRDQKKEFLRDLTAFANAQGGIIIYGIDEDRDSAGKPTGVAKSVGGFKIANRDAFILGIEQLLKDGIDERLPSHEIGAVPIDASNLVLMIRVPSSVRAPHMVIFSGERRFFVRGNSGKQEMSTSQIRDLSLRTQTFEEKTISFIGERLQKARKNIGGEESFWTLHLVPLFRTGTGIDVTNRNVINRLWQVSTPTGGNQAHPCLEGYKLGLPSADGHYNHTVFFRDGRIEFVDQCAFRIQESKRYLYPVIADTLIDCLDRGISLYRDGIANPPFAVCLSMTGLVNCFLSDRAMRAISVNEGDVILDPLVFAEFPQNSARAIRPLLDIIWNMFGHERCPAYDIKGDYIRFH